MLHLVGSRPYREAAGGKAICQHRGWRSDFQPVAFQAIKELNATFLQ